MAGVRWIAVVATVVAIAAAAAGCSSSGSGKNASGQVEVVAAENFWGNLAQQIGGSHVVVTSLITNPSADPHEFTSNVIDQLDVSHAGVVIVNGAGYDGFMSKLLSASPSAHRRVVTVANVLHVGGSNPNPHLWYDVGGLRAVVTSIQSALAAVDPAHVADYHRRLQHTLTRLQPLERAVGSLRVRYAGTRVAYTERVPGYLLATAGLQVVTPPGFARSIEDGTDPSFADTAAMRNVITQHKAKVLLYNSQAASPVAKQLQSLARGNGIPVVPVTETMPVGQTFESWQLAQVNALADALGSSGAGT